MILTRFTLEELQELDKRPRDEKHVLSPRVWCESLYFTQDRPLWVTTSTEPGELIYNYGEMLFKYKLDQDDPNEFFRFLGLSPTAPCVNETVKYGYTLPCKEVSDDR